MNSNPLLAAAVILIAFTAGWFIGRTTTLDIAQEARLSALQAEVAALREAGPAAAPAPGNRPPTRQAAAPAPTEVKNVEVGRSPVLGPEDAPITIVEFSDFQCPYCTRVKPTLAQVREEYGDQVRVVFKHFPLSFHTKAIPAHKAAIAAGDQGKFWEMHDLIFQNPKDLEPEQLRAHAETLNLDLAKFDARVNDAATEALITQDQAQGTKLGVRGTPSFFINGRFFSGAQPFAAFKARIDEELERGEQG
ncbi:MAG: thioredoxin domain-containing protein [Myxococcota bacterium]|nr:thioredoxin domain-containing protein [Myxococcota bacterium]